MPADAFWSISVYNAEGYFQKTDLDAYTLNNLNREEGPGRRGGHSIRRLRREIPNCLPIMSGWNYTARLYRPRSRIFDGTWKFPEAQPAR